MKSKSKNNVEIKMLLTMILKEHSKKQTMKIVKYVGGDPMRFDAMIKLFLGEFDIGLAAGIKVRGDVKYRVSQRAAWPVNYCAVRHPELIRKHLRKIILNLENPVHDAVKRNTIRLLQFIELPSSLHGLFTDRCFKLLNDPNVPVAVKVFSMTVIARLCQFHPGLKNELQLSIEAQLPYSTAGFRARANRILVNDVMM